MNFLIEKEKVIKILKLINNISFINLNDYNENNIIILIKNNNLSIIGNNSEIEIETRINILSKSDNTISVSYKKLLNILKNIPNKLIINFFTKNNFLFIKSEKFIFSICIYPVEKLNRFELENKILEISLNKDNICSLFKDTYFSIANKDARNCLNGMLINFNKNNIESITTDGYRLSFSKIILNNYINKNYKILIDKKSIFELIKFLNNFKENIIFIVYKKFYSVKINNSIFISRILNNEFPNCDNIIYKTYKYNLLINKNEFKESIKRISSILENKLNLLKIEIFSKHIIISSKNLNNEYAKEKIFSKYNGPYIEIGINYNYLIDILHILNSEYIIINIFDNLSGIELIEINNINKKYIVMPIKI